jgi:outer membrane protein assembly factor BamB
MKRFSALLGVCWLATLLSTSFALGGDWAAWRGPYQNGVSLETGITDSTKDILWRIPVGGRCTPVIFDGRIYAIHLTGKGISEQEEIFAVDAATGKDIWQYKFNCFHTDVTNSRVGWASVTVDPETGNVYANGVEGLILCLDGKTGKLIWSKSSIELYGRVSGYGGRTYTPIIDEDRVIVAFNNSSFGSLTPGAHRFVAFDKRTGDILWWGTPGGRPEDPTYSNPVVGVIGGQRLVVAGNADGFVYALKARTGEKVWAFHASHRGLNSSPVIDDYRVFVTHSEENLDTTLMGRVVCLDGRLQGDITKNGELWRKDGVDAGFASPLLHDGRLYVMTNSGRLFCYDDKTGKQYWKFKVGHIGKGSPVWADGKIYLTTQEGGFLIAEDKGTSCKLIDKMNVNDGAAPREEGVTEIFASPAISDGRIVIFTMTEMICFGKKDPKPQPVAAEKLPDEAPLEKVPASLVLRPAEVLLRPGEKAKFEVVAYDKHGRRIGPVDVKCTYPKPLGILDDDQVFTAGKKGGIGEIRAEVNGPAGKIAGAARLRLVPDLPISEDFESYQDGDIVPWWSGVSKLKYVVETLDGSKVLKKISNDMGPVFNNSLAFLTPPIPTGYTVEAYVRGAQLTVDGPTGPVVKRGDAGIVNSRYVLQLCDKGTKLQVYSWLPVLRFNKEINFNWPPDKWYRLKLKVQLVNGEAKIYAKAWPHEEPEPKEWTIEGTDPTPNYEGAAGIYANSTMAPVYFDNVKVYR